MSAREPSGKQDARLSFVDTHIHFWDLGVSDLRYSWLDDEVRHSILGNIDGLKSRRYTPVEYAAETRFQNVSKVVHVQAAWGIDDPVAETRWVQAVMDGAGLEGGIVGYTDLTDPRTGEALDRHCQSGRFRGVREYVENADFLDDPVWRRGFAELGTRSLVFCHNIEQPNMARAARFAAGFPSSQICLDHAGLPRSRSQEYFAAWREGIHALASQDNVACKISALGLYDLAWTVESLRPWVMSCIEAFGTDRCFFATNWPVDRLASSYGDLVDAYRTIVSEFSIAEQYALLSGNAERIFQI